LFCVIFLNVSTTVSLALRSIIELELSTTRTKGVLIISNVFLEIIGFTNNNNKQKIDTKRKKAKTKFTLDLVLALYK
jgi:hypothetical protein